MEEIYAKLEKRKERHFYQTLEGHVIDCLKIFCEYVSSNEKTIKQFCNRWYLNYDHFLSNLFLAIYLHDIGKATKQFQSRIREGKHAAEYPHPFFAFPIIFWLTINKIKPIFTVDVQNTNEKNESFEPPIELLSIIAHHTQLHKSIYENVNKEVKFFEDYIIQFINNSYKIYEIIGLSNVFEYKYRDMKVNMRKKSFYDLNPDESCKKSLSAQIVDMISIIKRYCENVVSTDKIKLKSIYSFFHSILQLCDDYSSLNFCEFIAEKENFESNVFFSVLENPKKYVLNLPNVGPCDILKDINNVLFNMYPYQMELFRDPKEFSLLFAPCGRGKTEAALLWAFEICKRHNRNKIIFAMPTQTTSNAMYERLCCLFGEGEKIEDRINDGKKHAGLFHGKSFLEHKETLKREKKLENDELTEEDLGEIKGEDFKGNIFFKSITVTTIDHIIHSFLRGFPQADFALGNIQNAVIIFDEVHYYEKLLLEHLMPLLRILKEMKIPNLLMSGTLPDFFINKVKAINPDYELIEDKEGLEFRPFYIETSDEFIVSKESANEKVINEIINNYENGLTQFIILNTVKRSQKVYNVIHNHEKLKGKPNIFLLHSEFIWSDRREKEKMLIQKIRINKEKPLILVSTQVIEISLDISCDRMYTEVAPADALGQRGGRLNRGAISPNGSVMKIFKPEEFFMDEKSRRLPRPYEFEILQKTVENIENREYSYGNIKKLCDIVYKDFVLEEKYEKFEEYVLFGRKPSGSQEDESKRQQIRDNSFQEIEVIPFDVVKKKIEEFCKKENIKTTFLSQQLPMKTIVKHLYESICEIKGISKKEKENILIFVNDEIKIMKRDEILEEFFKFLRDAFSVENETKIPYYIYKTNQEIFDILIYDKKYFRFVRIPYSNEIGFDYGNFTHRLSDLNFSNII